jgi:AcrR family transcriptional regulator
MKKRKPSRKTPDPLRKTPTQSRALKTREAIVEAAFQLLTKEGEAAVTTNRIAERAGVSVGSVYQYFNDKDAILLALINRERDAMAARIGKELEGVGEADVEAVTRRIIRAVIEAFRARRGARRLVMVMALKRMEEGGGKGVEAVADFIALAAARNRPHGSRPLSATAIYVLTRAVANTIRGAVIENSKILDDPEFEDELVRLAVAYLRAPA